VETSLFKLTKEKEIHHIIATAQKSGEWKPEDKIITNITPLLTHAAQQWAITENKAKPKTSHTLPKQYQCYTRIFSEDST
jgi:hypothetical protein